MSTDLEFVPVDYVYIGKRVNNDNKPFVKIQLVNDDGTLGEELSYEYSKKRDRLVGYVYKGASIDHVTKTIKGIDGAIYAGQWKNQAERLVWLAKHEDAEVTLRHVKLEKDSGKVSEIEQILLPLRKQYASMSSRRDYAGEGALERSVLRALRCAPRTTEK